MLWLRHADHWSRPRTRGPNTMTPMTAAPHAANRTAPAATSLAFSAIGWKSGEATSVRNSSAVLRASAVHTDVMANTIQHHSLRGNRTATPTAITATVATA